MLLTIATFTQLTCFAIIIYMFIHSIAFGFMGAAIWLLTIMYLTAKEQIDTAKGEK